MNLTLVVLAAGIGSRYGGIKQMDPVGPSGEILLDYAVFDAIHAGFNKVVFVIRKEIEAPFRERIGSAWEKRVETRYVFQRMELPAKFAIPAGRTKPWGTGHAALTAATAVNEPFAVINADDFYGHNSYAALARFLSGTASEDDRYAMVGFRMRNTLSEHGSVSRGLCETDSEGLLTSVVEITGIERTVKGIVCSSHEMKGRVFTGEEFVSLNLWGFKPSFFNLLEEDWQAFLKTRLEEKGAEFFLPAVVNRAISQGISKVEVLPSPDSWFGMTYPADKPRVAAAIGAMINSGTYPSNLREGR